MAGVPRPELIFLAGPQKGQRAVLMGDKAIIGRSASADVCISEEYVSRQQMQFALTPDGWVVENLSDRPVRINGKKFKAKKKVILDTGDLVGLGMTTEMLFVAPGDDPDEAIRAFAETHILPPAEPEPLAEPEPPEPSPPQEKPQPQEAAGEPKTQQIETDDESQKKKLKKYGIVFGAYALVMVVLVVWLMSWKGGGRNNGSSSGKPVILTDEQIAKVLTARLEGRSPNVKKSELKLKEAINYYEESTWGDGNLYLCSKRFKEHLAYRGSRTFSNRRHGEMFRKTHKELVSKIQDQYRNAFYTEKNRNWPDAQRQFNRLLDMVPEENEHRKDEAVYETLVKNIRHHLAYINRRLAKKK